MKNDINYVKHFEHVKKLKIAIIMATGRSGSGFLQSLLDGHSEILQLPDAWYFHEFWKKAVCKENLDDLIDEFIWYDVVHISKFKSQYNKFERWEQLGEQKNESFKVNINEFKKHLKFLLKNKKVNSTNFFWGIHIAYGLAIDQDVMKTKLIIYHLHHISKLEEFSKDFNNFYVISTIKDPRNAIISWVEHWKNYDIYNFMPHRFYHRLKRLFLESEPILTFTNNVKVIKLEDIHLKTSDVLNEICETFNIKFEKSMLVSTIHGKLWWGDILSQKYLQGFNPNINKKRWIGKLSSKDILIMEYLLSKRLVKYNYILENNVNRLMYSIFIPFLILLPMRYEIKILIQFIRLRHEKYYHEGSISVIFKIFMRSFYYYFARIKLYYKYYNKRNKLLLPESFASNDNVL